jgi:hypothetical protein
VEFQASSWSKGTYLNVGAMWLWDEREHHVRFDVDHRVEGIGYVEYESDEQFEPVAQELGRAAASEVQRLRATLPDLPAAIGWLSDTGGDEQGWPRYNLGVALGLAGRFEEAAESLRGLRVEADSSDWWIEAVNRAHALAGEAETSPAKFSATRLTAIADFRSALKLDPLDTSTFDVSQG